MAITTYHGLQGSGKTYEVVSEVVVGGARRARRIVTNIRGLKADAIAAYILKKWGETVTPEIVVVSNADIDSDEFLYYEVEQKGQAAVPAENTVTKPGDLVIVDEVWRFWSKGVKLRPNHFTHFRMHRQYSGADLVLITQDIADIHPDLRRVVERNFRMRKLKELDKSRYTVFQHDGNRATQSSLLQRQVKKYSPEVFALYESYAAGAAQETNVDSRTSFWSSGKLWKKAVMLLVFLAFGVGYLYWFFVGQQGKEQSKPSVAQKVPIQSATQRQGDSPSAAHGASPAPAPSAPKIAGAEASARWQKVGQVIVNNRMLLVLRSGDGAYRYEYDPVAFTVAGRLSSSGVVDGEGVASWTGRGGAGLLGGSK